MPAPVPGIHRPGTTSAPCAAAFALWCGSPCPLVRHDAATFDHLPHMSGSLLFIPHLLCQPSVPAACRLRRQPAITATLQPHRPILSPLSSVAMCIYLSSADCPAKALLGHAMCFTHSTTHVDCILLTASTSVQPCHTHHVNDNPSKAGMPAKLPVALCRAPQFRPCQAGSHCVSALCRARGYMGSQGGSESRDEGDL